MLIRLFARRSYDALNWNCQHFVLRCFGFPSDWQGQVAAFAEKIVQPASDAVGSAVQTVRGFVAEHPIVAAVGFGAGILAAPKLAKGGGDSTVSGSDRDRRGSG